MRTFLPIIIIAAAVLFHSCKDDEGIKDTRGRVNIDGSEYELSRGALLYEEVGSKKNGMFLMSDGLFINQDWNVEGRGTLMALGIISYENGQLSEGVYTLDAESNSFYDQPGDLKFCKIAAEVYTNSEGDIIESTPVFDCIEGKITVNRSGDVYSFSFDGEYYNENVGTKLISGEFSGELDIYIWED